MSFYTAGRREGETATVQRTCSYLIILKFKMEKSMFKLRLRCFPWYDLENLWPIHHSINIYDRWLNLLPAYPALCRFWCPEIGTSSINQVQDSRLFTWGQRQSPTSEKLFKTERGQVIMSEKSIIVFAMNDSMSFVGKKNVT